MSRGQVRKGLKRTRQEKKVREVEEEEEKKVERRTEDNKRRTGKARACLLRKRSQGLHGFTVATAE